MDDVLLPGAHRYRLADVAALGEVRATGNVLRVLEANCDGCFSTRLKGLERTGLKLDVFLSCIMPSVSYAHGAFHKQVQLISYSYISNDDDALEAVAVPG